MTKLKNIDKESKHGSKPKRHYISKPKPVPNCQKNTVIKLPLLQPCAQNLLVQNLTVCNKSIA
jgi:hypothetical protein